jgi:uncharacterized protein
MKQTLETDAHPTPFFLAYGKRPKLELTIFFALTFLITWGLAAVLFLAPDFASRLGGSHGVLFYVAVYAPSLAALLCLGLLEGRTAYAQVFKAVAAPGSAPRWLLWLIISFAIFPIGWLAMSALGQEQIGSASASVLFITVPITVLTTTYVLTDPGPLGEELGWRGYAMPRLLRVMHPILAGLLIGAIWALWHIPAFFVENSSQSGLSYWQFFGSLTAQGVVLTWLYLRTGGNWFFAGFIPHLAINCSAAMQGFSVDKWMYPLVPVVLACLVVFDPIMRSNKRLDKRDLKHDFPSM